MFKLQQDALNALKMHKIIVKTTASLASKTGER